MHTLGGIAEWVVGNFESGMDAAEIIENAVSSDASGESLNNSVSNSARKGQDTEWIHRKMKADGIFPDTMDVTYPNDTSKSLRGIHRYIKWNGGKHSHYMFQKKIDK